MSEFLCMEDALKFSQRLNAWVLTSYSANVHMLKAEIIYRKTSKFTKVTKLCEIGQSIFTGFQCEDSYLFL